MTRLVHHLIGSLALLLAWPAAGLELEGALTPGSARVLSVPVSGVVAEVAVEVGDRVGQGAALLRLDRRVFQAELRRSEAVLAVQEEVLAEARREWERAQELFDRTVMSERDLQLARNALLGAQADYATARARHTRAAWELEMSALDAPVAGRVVARHAHPGTVVISRDGVQPLLELVPAGHWQVVAALPTAQAAAYPVGGQVKVKVRDQDYAGRIAKRLGSAQNDAATTLIVEFTVGEEAELRSGMPVKLELP